MTPEEKYKQLLTEIIAKIDEIDKETPWRISEPKWWLKMMDLRTFIHKLNKIGYL